VNHLDLFSGIGGFALAAEWCGITTIGFSEIDPYACAVLKERWPKIKNYGDVRQITRETLVEGVDLITGGFPCQPFSTAGKRRGKEDDRFLWPELLRVIKEFRPTWVLGENVAGFINMELDSAAADLAAEGYEVQPVVIPACAVNAPHRRDRVWIIAHTEHPGFDASKKSESSTKRNDLNASRSYAVEQLAGCTGESASPDASGQKNHALPKSGVLTEHCDDRILVADTGRRYQGRKEKSERPSSISAGCGQSAIANAHGGRSKEQQLPSEGNQQCHQPTPDAQGAGLPGGDHGSWQEQLWRGYPFEHWRNSNWFEAATGLCGMGNGLPARTHRIKALGNAIVPQVAYEILKKIKTISDK